MEGECKSCKCDICGEEFVSKTKLFKHLSVHGFESKDSKPVKVVLLVGWMSDIEDCSDEWVSGQSQEIHSTDATSKRIEDELFRALYLLENNCDRVPEGVTIERPKGFSRGSSCLQRTSPVFGSEPTCHGQSDTIGFLVKPFGVLGVDGWQKRMNENLPESIRIHHVYALSPAAASNFHAETDCTQRRYEYIFPLRLILPANAERPTEPIVRRRRVEHHANLPKTSRLAMDQKFPAETEEGQIRIAFFRKLKKIFKDLAGKFKFHNFVSGGAAPGDASITRRLDRIYHKEILTISGEDWVVFSISGDALLKGQVRKLIGLTLCIALDVFPMSYIDVALDGNSIAEIPAVPGWAMYLAECRYACWEAKYLDFKLDPRREENGISEEIDLWTEKLHLRIAEISRRCGDGWMEEFLCSAREMYARFLCVDELKKRGQTGLEDLFQQRFGAQALLQAKEVELQMSAVSAAIQAELEIAREKEKLATNPTKGNNNNKRQKKTKDANNGQQQPPAVEIIAPKEEEKELESSVVVETAGPSGRTGKNAEYLQYAAKLSFIEIPLESDDVPSVYAEVFRLLRLADRSQNWPASSTGRQMVISQNTLLEVGGRGGSFSVGALPRHLAQPKGNIIFPELMRACFRLERALMPDRPPSATIAINRHAEFLPHRDSGAGAGQTKSLIVALGAFSGGEIVVDHIPHDIRYKPIEFDGWQSLHYTMPFVGERYSLVWFTPLGLSREDMWWWDQESMDTSA